jgi:hypothetical protein
VRLRLSLKSYDFEIISGRFPIWYGQFWSCSGLMEISKICAPETSSALLAPCCIFSFELFLWSLSLRYDVMVRIPLFCVEASPPYSSLAVLVFTTEYYWCYLELGYFLAWYSSFKEGRLSRRYASFKDGSFLCVVGRQSTEY